MKLPFAAGLALALACTLGPARAQTALYQYADADLALGEKLIRDNRCTACHVRRVGGDGSSIYRPPGPHQQPRCLARHGRLLQQRAQPGSVSRRRHGRRRGAAARPLPFPGIRQGRAVSTPADAMVHAGAARHRRTRSQESPT